MWPLRCEVHLIPTQVRRLARPQAVPVGHKDHRAVAVTPMVSLGGPEQPFDLGFRQVFAGAQVCIGTTGACDCSLFGGWRDQLQARFDHVFGSSLVVIVLRMHKLRTVSGACVPPGTW